MPGYRDQFSRFAHIYDFLIKNPITTVVEAINPDKNDVILDLGGGTGQIAEVLVDKVAEVHLLDPSPLMLSKVKKKNGKVKTKLGVAEKCPYPSSYFDKVLVYDALHHFENPIQAIYEVNRMLKPGGRLIIGDIDPRGFWGKMLILFEKVIMVPGVYFSPKELTSIIRKTNPYTVLYYKILSPVSYIMVLHKKPRESGN